MRSRAGCREKWGRWRSRRGAVAALLVAAGLGAGDAGAIDPVLCADDGVTEVPPFAAARDASQCLLVDPGNGDPPVPFQYEIFHQVGMSIASKDPGESPPGGAWIDTLLDAYGRCSTKEAGQFCTSLVWNTTIDNYLSPAGEGDDILIYGPLGLEYLYFKDTVISNGWRCSGKAWTGPNGIHCEAVKDGSHTDGIQMLGTMANDGWLVFQDSALVNSHISLLLLQGNSSAIYTPSTNFLFQGFQLGTVNTPVGAAVNWIDDCFARGAGRPCNDNRAEGGMPAGEVWLIDTFGNVRFRGDYAYDKVVVVNTGCGTRSCAGPIEYFGGWPHPLGREDPSGPGTCPNGFIGFECQGDANTACFCYTSIEAALADTATTTSNVGDCPAPHCPHARPPFLQHSSAGWANQPPTP